MAAVGRGSSAGVLAPVTVHISAATFPIACVDSVPPVPGRAGICALDDAAAGSRERARSCGQVFVCRWQQARGVRLAHRSRRQKVAGRSENSGAKASQKGVRFQSGHNAVSVPLREQPPQRGPRQFSVERLVSISMPADSSGREVCDTGTPANRAPRAKRQGC